MFLVLFSGTYHIGGPPSPRATGAYKYMVTPPPWAHLRALFTGKMHAKSTFSDEHFEYIHVSYVLLKVVTLCRFCKPRHKKTSVLYTFSMISVHLCMKPAYSKNSVISVDGWHEACICSKNSKKNLKDSSIYLVEPWHLPKLLSFLSFSSICRFRVLHLHETCICSKNSVISVDAWHETCICSKNSKKLERF